MTAASRPKARTYKVHQADKVLRTVGIGFRRNPIEMSIILGLTSQEELNPLAFYTELFFNWGNLLKNYLHEGSHHLFA